MLVPFVLLALRPPLAFAADLPAFSVERGVYDAPFDLALTAAVTTDTLYCSTDHSEPTAQCAAPLTISGTTTLRVRALGADGAWSPTTTQTYLFPADILTQARMDPAIVQDAGYGPILDDSLRTSPSISVVLPGAMSETEQAISLEWIDPAGEDPSDSSQVNCGANIIGGTSQVYEKTTFRVHFRSEYGASKWDHDIYGDYPVGVAPTTSFDALSLRSGNHDSLFYLGTAGQYTRNYWMDETQLEMGHLAPHGKYVQLYVNGSYNGQYHVRERFDAGFMASYLGGEEEDYDAVNGGSVFDGTSTAWNQLVTYASVSDYAGVESLLNVENFLDYMVLNWYAANAWDWAPDHNWISAGPSEPNQGGFIFHSSDSDICLYYAPNTNILSNPGPSYLFQYLITSRDPRFMVALEDAIHRNLENEGPLTSTRATERYARIAGLAEHGVIGDSARFGYGGWSRDGDWIPQRDWLLNVFFVLRTSNLLGQVKAAGWYPLDAPTFDTAAGLVAVGTVVGAEAPASSTGELWVTTDGSDPRAEDGSVSSGATGPSRSQAISLVHGAELKARILQNGTWGPVETAAFDVDEGAPLVLNEWSAVATGKSLEDGDSALGTVDGNGGDWIELLVVEDHLDIRGWCIVMHDRHQVDWILTFTDELLLEDLRAGTIITLAEDLPEDAAYDPGSGDWRFHLRVTADGVYVRPTGAVSSTGGFEVTDKDWQARIVDSEGWTRASGVGEGLNGLTGLGSDEAGQLAETPGADFRPWSGLYRSSDGSTFGSPNTWSDGKQDLSGLRGEGSTIHDIGDTGAAPTDSTDSPGGAIEVDPACGCRSGRAPSGAVVLLLAGLATRRRPVSTRAST